MSVARAIDQSGGNRATGQQLVDSHPPHGRTDKLFLTSTGIISASMPVALLALLAPNITREFDAGSPLELGRSGLLVRG